MGLRASPCLATAYDAPTFKDLDTRPHYPARTARSRPNLSQVRPAAGPLAANARPKAYEKPHPDSRLLIVTDDEQSNRCSVMPLSFGTALAETANRLCVEPVSALSAMTGPLNGAW